jgi:hypothetical protein
MALAREAKVHVINKAARATVVECFASMARPDALGLGRFLDAIGPKLVFSVVPNFKLA